MAPFRQYIVKLHSRCNLSCTYCYVYHHIDQSWRDRPRIMSGGTIAAMARRIGEHAAQHDLDEVVMVLHGGEPLLAGPAIIERTITAVRSAVPRNTRVDVTLQTNGTLIDDRLLEVFHRHDVGVGVSLDGGRAATNRHRVYAGGRPSFEAVATALHKLDRPEHREIYAGVLCTVDLENDPLEVYQDLIAFHPAQVDLLLPLANWVHPPTGHSRDAGTTPDAGATPYADWLIAVFDRWFLAPRREVGIRLFESLIKLLLGGSSDTEAVGLDSADAITIETDGSLEITDALKTTAPGLGALGLSVHTDPFDTAMKDPRVAQTRREFDLLSSRCKGCPVATVCGGGQYSHRYGPDGGFSHPSVYCYDLVKLIGHIDTRVRQELAARVAHVQPAAG